MNIYPKKLCNCLFYMFILVKMFSFFASQRILSVFEVIYFWIQLFYEFINLWKKYGFFKINSQVSPFYFVFNDRIWSLDGHDLMVLMDSMNNTFWTNAIANAIKAKVRNFLIGMFWTEPLNSLKHWGAIVETSHRSARIILAHHIVSQLFRSLCDVFNDIFFFFV